MNKEDTGSICIMLTQAIRNLKNAHKLLDKIDGMGDYTNHIERAIEDLEQELGELESI